MANNPFPGWKWFLTTVLGTTVSILMTFGTSALIERHQRNKDRKMSALMVMSNIESFAREMDRQAQDLSRRDSSARWLLSMPLEALEKAPSELFDEPLQEVIYLSIISHDKTAENIFSNNIETWKNMGNVNFIDNVGKCFSDMNWIEEYWNSQVSEYDEDFGQVRKHPENYPGNSMPSKYLQNMTIRQKCGRIHSMVDWFEFNAATLRQSNRRNMDYIGITEKEVMEFTNRRTIQMENEEKALRRTDFQKPALSFDSLYTMRDRTEKVKEFLRK